MKLHLRAAFKTMALATMLFVAGLLLAQSTTSNLQGTVADSTGAVIPNAQVTAVNKATNLTRTTQSDASGNYLIPALPHGNYDVTVVAQGLGKQIVRGLTLDVGRTVAQNFTLKPAAVNETVEITGAAPVVESTTMTVGEVVNAQKVQDLPLNGRHMLELAAIVPGTVIPPATGFLTAPIRGQGALGVNTAGTREGTTNFMVNGINLVDMGNGQITFQPSINTISEFKMDNSTPSAEYGRNGGGVINVATRSGTNAFHGEVFDFLRNNAFDARNFFNKVGTPMSPFKRNDFGAAVGGPIWKDHSFFFVSYEGLRQRQLTPVSTTVLTDAQRQQVVTNGDPIMQKLLPLIPQATNGGNLFQGGLTTPVLLDQWTGDFRQVFSEKDTLHGFYVLQRDLRHEPTSDGNDVPGAGDVRHARRQILTLDETHVVSNTMVNALRAGIQRINITFIPENNMDPSAIGLNNGKTGPIGLPQFRVGGTNLSFGGASNFPQGRADYTATLNDTVSYLRGNHNIRFGGEYRRYNGNGFTNDDGSVSFANMAAFIAATPNGFTVNSSNRSARVYESALGLFAQDSYKATRYLTLEFGLRWEWNTSPTEAGNRNSVFDPTRDWLLQVGTNGRNNVYNQNDHLFQPRVGFAWDVLHDGRTVLRGGYGIMYDQPNPISFVSNYPYNVGLSFVPTKTVPTTSFATLLADAKGSGFTIATVDPNYKDDYIQSWNLNLQREITPTLGVMIGYIGNEGTHLNQFVNVNQFVNGVRPFAFLAANSPIQLPAGVGLGNITERVSNGTSNYNAMWVSVTKRVTHGLQFGGNYTWSHAMDETSGDNAGSTVTNALNPMLDYGPSNYDARHHLSFNAVYALPFKGSRLVQGWQAAGILALQSGNPLNVVAGNPGAGAGISSFTGLSGIRPDLVGPLPAIGETLLANGNVQWFSAATVCDPSTGNGCGSGAVFAIPVAAGGNVFHFGSLGRNAMVGPGFENVDFSITKTTKITERLSNEFRVETFDIFNHPNFSNPNTTAQFGSSNFGVISATRGAPGDAGSSRQMQFAMKFIF
jgi:hypothetical protein